jgi:shikimate kinase/3-dehydroquinate synthase
LKISVVAEDERDQGRRAVLNLGHTVGHAIETASGYGRYRHGEAVGLGLLAALRLSEVSDLRSEVAALLEANRLPTRLDPSVAIEDVLIAMGRDKKRRGEDHSFVLLNEPGDIRLESNVAERAARAAIEELQE